jgi:aryl-alcohol dehydrogenase-like predicted oxidoreductase
VILGASKVAQLDENLKASAAAEKLTPEVLSKIDDLFGNRPKARSNADNH